MAEEFLEPIFQKAILISDFEESLACLRKRDFSGAKRIYNSAIDVVEKLLPELAQANPNLAEKIMDCAQAIADCWNDASSASGLIGSTFLPLLYEYMSFYANIDVSEGKYRIFSSDCGFLTINDTDLKLTFHDIHNPMSEAAALASSLYSPNNKEIHILGCDLGYLPYKLYKLSEGACRIVIYEYDCKMISYARQFGILSWIPEGICEFVTSDDPADLAVKFLTYLNNNEKAFQFGHIGVYVNHWMCSKYHKLGIDQIEKQFNILSFKREKYNVCVRNMMKNYDRQHISFDDLLKRTYSDEWILVAAGPSLDDNIQFIKESAGQKTIVAVNTVLKRLPVEGIIPDLLVAADPRSQLSSHIKGFEESTRKITLIADESTSWEYIESYLGDICFVPTPNGEGLPLSNPENMDIWPISGTVVTLGIESAIRLGAQKIYLVGLDLAFPGGITYASGVSQKREEVKAGNYTVKSVDGKMVASNQTFDMFRQIIEEQISRHPKIDFINMSQNGALIKGARTP